MVGVLSIDFDYFIDVAAWQRDVFFPKGSDEISKDQLSAMWKERYIKYPKLKEVGLIHEYYVIREFLRTINIKEENFYIADTHKKIRNLIERIPWNKKIFLVNIDFHHDYYHYFRDGDRYNCGNWLRRLIEERPDTKVKWIRRLDSQTYSLEGAFPFEHTTDIRSIFKEQFDYVFICRSPEWSPPHLRHKFEELKCVVTKGQSA